MYISYSLTHITKASTQRHRFETNFKTIIFFIKFCISNTFMNYKFIMMNRERNHGYVT